MFLDRVTITGADDRTSITRMLELSGEFQWLEWGILVSHSREGTSRYPGRQWCSGLATVAIGPAGDLNLAMHVCGRWARLLFSDSLDWFTLPKVYWAAGRIQINGTPDTDSSLAMRVSDRFIFQLPRALDFARAAQRMGIMVDGLFDESGGEGIIPTNTPLPEAGMYCGYAGGIGPDNVVERIEKIQALDSDAAFWIDMEGRVRTEDDVLDLDKVERVLRLCAPHVRSLVPTE